MHRDVAAVALLASAEHGFVLGGGKALTAYGVIDRPTEDVEPGGLGTEALGREAE